MKNRSFGNTGLEVSEICFGPMRFSAKEPGDDAVSRTEKRALERALERGVNFIHSSYEYGTRWAVSDVLATHPRRHELHHVIKVPVPDFEDGGHFDAGKFRLRVEEALRDLHTEHIAVLQHLQRSKPNSDERRIPDIPTVHPALLETFQKLRDEGLVGALTTFPYTPGFARAALDTGDFTGLVAYYNVIEMEMADFFPGLQEQGHGVLCIRPFMAGLLTDRRADRAALPEDDRWDAAYARLEQVRTVFGQGARSWTAFAIQFALAHPIVSSLIVGLNTPEQVDQVIDAAESSQLHMGDFEQAYELYQREEPV